MCGKICSVDGCGKHAHSRGWCEPHYRRWLRNGSPTGGRASPNPGACCSIDGCGMKIFARGLCRSHYLRMRRYGNPTSGRARPNPGSQCDANECKRPAIARGLCTLHYQKLMKHGSAGYERTFPAKRRCSVDGCDALELGRRGLCNRHFQRFLKYGTYDLPVRDRKIAYCQCGAIARRAGMCKKCFRIAAKKGDAGKLCSVCGCTRSAIAKGLCESHYKRVQVGSDTPVNAPIKRVKYATRCSVVGCKNKYFGCGLCNAHYQQHKQHGRIIILKVGGKQDGSIRVVRCKCCREPFSVLTSEVRRGHGEFCSHSCATSYHNKVRGSGGSPKAKLCWHSVGIIRSSEESVGVLASRFGVARETIAAVRSFRTWKEVEHVEEAIGRAQGNRGASREKGARSRKAC